MSAREWNYQGEAIEEGWGLFKAAADFQIQRVLSVNTFGTDADAIEHVIRKARSGSQMHQEALEWLKAVSPDEYYNMLEWNSHRHDDQPIMEPETANEDIPNPTLMVETGSPEWDEMLQSVVGRVNAEMDLMGVVGFRVKEQMIERAILDHMDIEDRKWEKALGMDVTQEPEGIDTEDMTWEDAVAVFNMGIIGTGGNCTAWALALNNGVTVVVTDRDGISHLLDEEVEAQISWMDTDDWTEVRPSGIVDMDRFADELKKALQSGKELVIK